MKSFRRAFFFRLSEPTLRRYVSNEGMCDKGGGGRQGGSRHRFRPCPAFPESVEYHIEDRLGSSPCRIQTPNFWAWLLHPSWLQRFLTAPCRIQTPNFWAWLVHPSWLQSFFPAPCRIQTPNLWAWLVHPSWLQRFLTAPCRTQTPSLLTLLVHPTWLQHLGL